MANNKKGVFFSIIIPVYNSELYLKTCIDSILDQNFEDFELLLVNDGSTDSSRQIMDLYAKQDSRIYLIHKKNGGQGSARNAALKIAQGKYIMFVDSDDAIGSNTLLQTYEVLSKNPDIDCLQFPIYMKYGTEDAYILKGKEALYQREDDFKTLLLQENVISWIVCNKVVKRQVLQNLFFPEKMVFEDNFFVLDLIDRLNSIYISENGLYYYYKRKNSTTTSKYSLDSELSTLKVLIYVLNKLNLPKDKNLFYKYLIRLINVHKSLKVNFGAAQNEFYHFREYVSLKEVISSPETLKNKIKILSYKYF